MANNTFRIPIPIGHPIYEVNNGHIEEYEVIGYRIGRMMGEDREDYEEDYGDYDGWRIEVHRYLPLEIIFFKVPEHGGKKRWRIKRSRSCLILRWFEQFWMGGRPAQEES